MRPGQNKRMRGRNNNRKGPNPLTRSYESNGPDVKIRGTAHHVAEKYLQLARDAQSSGDPVMAESYLQHAEHYFRLIAAAQTAQLQAQQGYTRPPGEADAEDFEDEDDVGGMPDRFASPERFQPQPFSPPPQPHFTPQPQASYPDRQPYFGNGQDRQSHDRPQGHDRQDRSGQDRPDRPDQRGFRPDRPFQDRQGQNRDGRGGNRDQRPPRPERSEQPPEPRRPPVFTAEPETAPELPAFITAPVRINGSPETDVGKPEGVEQIGALQPEVNGEADHRFPLHQRRRRRPRPPFGLESPEADSAPGEDDRGALPPTETPVGE
jgi:hypothetical protein